LGANQEVLPFGLHDSVSFAIEVEDRYKGIRAPHKLKGGVSGCVRECAEAQSKDFGIIATEKGWNLYVCGNGGSKPQHAQLLANDIDKETLVKYLDRFLTFYIKTADPLPRTATWLNKMDGGMSYLKNVVKSNKINFGAERFFLRADIKLISFAAYNNNVDIRIEFQFFSKF
jgi:nitrite reductase (NADH) large subunit